jgi:hypothetical protein
VFSSFSDEIDWKEVFKVRTGRILCIEPAGGTDNVYLGALDGLYESKDIGESWKKTFFPGKVSEIRDIAAGGEDAVIATRYGIYVGKGGSWKRLRGKKSVSGVAVFSGPKKKNIILAWSGKDLFKVTDERWTRIGSEALWGSEIVDVKCADNIINVASGGDIFISSDGGNKWEKISLLWKKDLADEMEENASFKGPEGLIEDRMFSPIGNIDLDSNGNVIIATTRGIYVVQKGSKTAEKIDTTGLPSARVRYATKAGEDLFAATDKSIFRYNREEKIWQTVFEKPVFAAISLLSASAGGDGEVLLWAVDGKFLYRCSVGQQLTVRAKHEDGEKPFNKKPDEPSILEVQRMAIDYAEVSPEKIRRWRSGARWKAIMPRLSLGFSESIDDNIDIYKSSTKSYVIRGPRERGTDWDIDLTWDLSDLIWNDAQTSIDVRSKLMVQLRDEVLEEVTRLYFERKRLLAGLEGTDQKDRKKFRENRLRIEELTAHIDALTGGEFSEALSN